MGSFAYVGVDEAILDLPSTFPFKVLQPPGKPCCSPQHRAQRSAPQRRACHRMCACSLRPITTRLRPRWQAAVLI